MRTFTALELAELVGDEGIPEINDTLRKGDGIAVYANMAMDHSELGRRRFFSFGSATAQFVVPPEQLPDFPGEINWRYQLEGVYRGTEVDPPAAHDWASPATVLELICSSFRSPIAGRPDRLIGYGLDVDGYAERSVVTFTLRVTEGAGVSPSHGSKPVGFAGQMLTPLIPHAGISITALTNERGEVDRLGSFSWQINSDTPIAGQETNLGSTIVNVHNLSMEQAE